MQQPAQKQAAALQLLSSLKNLKTLQLGGAELLLPSIPHFPVAAVHAPPAPPAPSAAAAADGQHQQQSGLLPQLSTSMSLATATAAAGSQTDLMRSMLLSKACELDQFKLQFNCCGTGVEKVRAVAARLGVCFVVMTPSPLMLSLTPTSSHAHMSHIHSHTCSSQHTCSPIQHTKTTGSAGTG